MAGVLEVEAKSTAEPADLVERRLEVERLEQKLLDGHQVVEAGWGGAAAAAQNGVQSVYKDTPGKETRGQAAAIYREKKGQRTAGFYKNLRTSIEISIAVPEERRWNN